jgi:hypothetical protein
VMKLFKNATDFPQPTLQLESLSCPDLTCYVIEDSFL